MKCVLLVSFRRRVYVYICTWIQTLHWSATNLMMNIINKKLLELLPIELMNIHIVCIIGSVPTILRPHTHTRREVGRLFDARIYVAHIIMLMWVADSSTVSSINHDYAELWLPLSHPWLWSAVRSLWEKIRQSILFQKNRYFFLYDLRAAFDFDILLRIPMTSEQYILCNRRWNATVKTSLTFQICFLEMRERRENSANSWVRGVRLAAVFRICV